MTVVERDSSPEWDSGPTEAFAKLFARAPRYEEWGEHFRRAWGPVFYRGRLDGSARIMVIAQSPGPAELITRRGLSGLAGQRIQRFLEKLGLDRSYVMGNAFLYGLQRPLDDTVREIARSPQFVEWRSEFYDMMATPRIEAVIAIGKAAQEAVDMWKGSANRWVVRLDHPNYEMSKGVFANWNDALGELLSRVTPDAGVEPDGTPYGTAFTPADQSPIPERDLPFGAPRWLGSGEIASRPEGTDTLLVTPTAQAG